MMSGQTVTLAELKQRLEEIVEALETSADPVYVTQDGQPRAVLLRPKDFESLVRIPDPRHPLIVRRSGVRGGDPTIAGSRIGVQTIVEYDHAGQSVEEILEAFPHLTVEKVQAALNYYRDHKQEIDKDIEESHPDRVAARLGFRWERIDDGIAIARFDKEHP